MEGSSVKFSVYLLDFKEVRSYFFIVGSLRGVYVEKISLSKFLLLFSFLVLSACQKVTPEIVTPEISGNSLLDDKAMDDAVMANVYQQGEIRVDSFVEQADGEEFTLADLESYLDVQATLAGAAGVICYIEYVPTASKAWRILVALPKR
ncbi:MAG: hypothetical protein R2865_15105 [Deinococcales bacterium]